MKTYLTEIKAIDPIDGELKTFGGPNIISLTPKLAEEYLQLNGLGYCKIIGELIMEVPCKKETFEPDWNNTVNFETNLN